MSEYYILDAKVKDIDLKFETSNKVFSPKSIDKGTLAMLSVVEFEKTDKVLDLGCGYGIVGILAAKILGIENVVMTDKDSIAVELSKKNAALNSVEGVKIIQSDGFKNLDEKDFTMILSNPPYHTDFSVAKEFIEKGFNRLCIGGRMYMVTKRKDWYKNKLTAIFGGTNLGDRWLLCIYG
ncbi:class I SAM-dependent methyltransferase [Ruminiclostridium josui]|uniref:class I SAM-dependent methyltransferase n=1 Tax=Ruminiclostridium josui TaxID=1499 RepID=UPI000A737EAF|nr:methyltransferase [Ruminiclostridium josui]